MSRLRTYTPLRRQSTTRQTPRGLFSPRFERVMDKLLRDPVYARVDRRSDGFCEVTLGGLRCQRRATDHHHTVKPRRSHHTEDLVMAICRSHHDRVDWPYHRGKLRVRALGQGRFACAIVTAPDKFTHKRASGE